MPLDLTDSRSVRELAGEIGGKVDILVNTAECHRTFGITARRGVESAQLEMDVNYFGLLAARAGVCAGAQSARGRRPRKLGRLGQRAVDLCARQLSRAHGTYSASKAAAYSLSQALRAELRPAGVRVINLFPGPIDDEWDQLAAAAENRARRRWRPR